MTLNNKSTPSKAIGEIVAVSNVIGLGTWHAIANMRRR